MSRSNQRKRRSFLEVIFLLVILTMRLNLSAGGITKVDGYTTSPTDNADLFCSSDASPKPRNIQWSKNGKEIKTTPGQFDVKSESLEIIHTDEEDVGEYICKDVGNGDSARVYLNAGAWSRNGKDIVKRKGDTFTVDCNAWGYPTPEISWFKDGTQLKSDGSHYIFEDRPTLQPNEILKNGRLRISKSSVSDTGKYKCLATTPTGNHAASTSVLVKNPLDILWPILGILLLLILLGVGIGLYFYFTRKLKMDEKKGMAKKRKLQEDRQKQQLKLAGAV